MRPDDRDLAYVLDIVMAARRAIEYLGERERGALEADDTHCRP